MSRWTTVTTATATETQVIHALILREIKSRFGRLKLGYLWAVFEPAAFVALFSLIFALAHETAPSGIPVVQFMLLLASRPSSCSGAR